MMAKLAFVFLTIATARARIHTDQRTIAEASRTIQQAESQPRTWPYITPLHRWRDEDQARRAIAAALADETRTMAALAHTHTAKR